MQSFTLLFTPQANKDLDTLEKQPDLQKQLKAVKKALALLESNIRHPSLQTHKYKSIKGLNGADVFTAYAENSTFKAYRIFWQYGIPQKTLTIINILPHQ